MQNLLMATSGYDTSSDLSSETREKRLWIENEDKNLIAEVEAFKTRYGSRYNWTEIAKHMPDRTREQCRKRWKYKLDPGMKREQWTVDEEKILLSLQATYGNKWAKIGMLMNGRSDVEVKNHYFVLQRKNNAQEKMSNLFNTAMDSVQSIVEPNNNLKTTGPTIIEQTTFHHSTNSHSPIDPSCLLVPPFSPTSQHDASTYLKIMNKNRPPGLLIR